MFVKLYLILLQAALRHRLVSLLLKGDDDEGHEDVDKEEGEDDKVHHVKDGDLYPVAWARTLVLKRGVHRVLQDSGEREIEREKEQEQNRCQSHFIDPFGFISNYPPSHLMALFRVRVWLELGLLLV